MGTFNHYLEKNKLTNRFNNDATQQYLVDVMTGGSDCRGMNIYKYTMRNLHNKNLLVNELQGGRVLMPMEFFGAPSTHYHAHGNNHNQPNYSDINTVNIKQALPINQMSGGANNTFMKEYNKNMNKFTKQLKSTIGKTSKITKKTINEALSTLNLNTKKN